MEKFQIKNIPTTDETTGIWPTQVSTDYQASDSRTMRHPLYIVLSACTSLSERVKRMMQPGDTEQ